jgi:hypothetical protein
VGLHYDLTLVVDGVFEPLPEICLPTLLQLLKKLAMLRLEG